MNKDIKIKFENFSFRYQTLKYPTLKGINIEIYEGEKVLITGRSGSGKSTVMHCLNGLIPSSMPGDISGRLIIDGVEPYKKNTFETSKKVGTLLQDQDAQFVGLTVEEDVAFLMENDAVPKEIMKRKVDKSLGLVNLREFASYSPYELSGGQKQRTSLAGLLTSHAEIFVFDEPLANLDSFSGKTAVRLMSEISKATQKTIIIVEHRIEEILEVGFDKIIIMENGEILASDTPSNILASGILKRAGLREPLYIEALRMAQVDLTKIEKVDSVDSFAGLDIKEKMLKEFDTVPKKLTPAREVLLSVENLSFSFVKERKVLEDLSFEIGKGEIISLLGNNGTGKTTLSFLIAGFIPCKKGRIVLGGKEITNATISARGKKIGLVMQDPNTMIVKNTVKAEVSLGLEAARHKKKHIEEKTEEVLRVCDLWGYRNWPISSLSYGQKKRVTIASILSLDPNVIILDEPTAGQDIMTYTPFMEFIKSLSNKGIAIILITHDMQLALQYSTRSIVLSKGKKIADGPPADVLSRKEVLSEASIRETSLYSLAEVLNIDKQAFVNSFLEKRE